MLQTGDFFKIGFLLECIYIRLKSIGAAVIPKLYIRNLSFIRALTIKYTNDNSEVKK